MPQIDTLQIRPRPAGPELTPQQKRFNTLIRQIEKARATLAEWHDSIATYRKAHVEVLLPLEAELRAAQRQWVFALDQASHRREWTKAERQMLGELVAETASALLADAEDDAP